jgi:hypothetical protein
MSVTSTNLIAGPGDLYTGNFGVAEPADTDINIAPAASGWTNAGGTDGGVTLKIAESYMTLTVDQVIDTPERRRTSREVTMVTNLAEPTLENLSLVLNGGTVATATGSKSYDPADGNAATQMTYKSLLFDGFAPSSFRRRVICRKVLSTDDVSTAYKKDDQTFFPVTFTSHYVSSSIKPFRVLDQTA